MGIQYPSKIYSPQNFELRMCYVPIAFYLDVISVDIHDDKEEELDKNENGIICSICLLIRKI